MDFTLRKEHEMARALFKEFAEKEVRPLASILDEEERFPVETIPKLFKYGFFGAAAFAVPIITVLIAIYWKKAYISGKLKYKVILSILLLVIFAMMKILQKGRLKNQDLISHSMKAICFIQMN